MRIAATLIIGVRPEPGSQVGRGGRVGDLHTRPTGPTRPKVANCTERSTGISTIISPSARVPAPGRSPLALVKYHVNKEFCHVSLETPCTASRRALRDGGHARRGGDGAIYWKESSWGICICFR